MGDILITDDERDIRELISDILKDEGFTTRLAGTSDECMAQIDKETPALMILDVMLPGQSGFDILRTLRADPQAKELPVIMLTAKGQSSSRDLAMECGASLFMSKPFANRDLLDAVRDLVQG